jgi:hypothetical protein
MARGDADCHFWHRNLGLRYYTWFVFLVSVYKLLDMIDVELVMVCFFGALCFSCCFYEDYGRDALENFIMTKVS